MTSLADTTASPSGWSSSGRVRPRALFLIENVSVPPDPRAWGEACALRDAGFDVTIISPQGSPPYDALVERRDGIAIHRYRPVPRILSRLSYAGEYAWAVLNTTRHVLRLQNRAPFDVVHFGNPPDLLVLCAIPVRWRGGVVVFDHHDLVPELFRARFGHNRFLYSATLLVERLAFLLSDVVISTNDTYKAVALDRGRKPPDRVFVVRNAPDTRVYLPKGRDPRWERGGKRLISYVGIMGPQDGVDHALRALRLLRDRDDWYALFVGSGTYVPEAIELVKRFGLADRVEFTGYLPREDCVSILSASDVCLSPEPSNPFNDASTMMKVSEYMAVGRPIVAFDLPESRVTAGPAALYAEPNDIHSFAACIGRLLDDPVLGEALGREGRRRVEDSLSWERSRRGLLAAYDRVAEVLRSRRRGVRHGD